MKIGERGQVTIPKSLRERYGLTPKSEVEFVEINGQLVLRKKPGPPGESIRQWVGLLKGRPDDVDEFIKEIRGQ